MSSAFCSASSRVLASARSPAVARHARPRFAKAAASRKGNRLDATCAAARKCSEARHGARAISYHTANSAATMLLLSPYPASRALATLPLHEAFREGDTEAYSAL